jgi:hypothetical protein
LVIAVLQHLVVGTPYLAASAGELFGATGRSNQAPSTMNLEMIKRAEHIYCSAQEIQSPDERKTFLDRECRGDARLRALVEQWLADQPKVEEFFQTLIDSLVLPGEHLKPHSGGRDAISGSK